jgi:hypothetical protein
MYGVYTVFLAGISPNIRSYTVYIYGSGQPYVYNYASIYRAPFQGVCLVIRLNRPESKKVYFSKQKIYACVLVAQ